MERPKDYELPPMRYLETLTEFDLTEFDYKITQDDEIDPINQIKRNKEREIQTKIVNTMFFPAIRRFERLMKRANNFLNDGYQQLTLFDKCKSLKRIDLIFSRILKKQGLFGPRAEELQQDYRQKLKDLEAKATGRSSSLS